MLSSFVASSFDCSAGGILKKGGKKIKNKKIIMATSTLQLEFSQAMADFRKMFPDIDREVIEAVLRANLGAVDQTIDQLLAMSTDNQVHMRVCVCVYVRLCVCMFACVCVCVCLCILLTAQQLLTLTLTACDRTKNCAMNWMLMSHHNRVSSISTIRTRSCDAISSLTPQTA